MMLFYINWMADPAIFTIPDFSIFSFHFESKEIRWYSMAFILGFFVFGYKIMESMWRKENINPNLLNPLLYYTFFGTIIGARLGHCLFYAPSHYLANPIEILKVWEGGLASHGGVIGIIISTWIYSKTVVKENIFWTFDKLVTPTGLVAALIRIGNLMNHEIYGHPTNLPWGFRFIENLQAWQQGAQPIFTPPCHPTQIYEAIAYLLTFGLCMWLYFKKQMYKQEGFIFGVFMICIFTARFLIEFVKNNQEDFENTMILNMGQYLSIPFIVLGIWSICRSQKITNKSNGNKP